MSVLVGLAGTGIAVLGITYCVVPKRVYHFGFDFLRDSQSEPSEASDVAIWVHRLIGVNLVLVGISYMLSF